jgi:hypothetical protein
MFRLLPRRGKSIIGKTQLTLFCRTCCINWLLMVRYCISESAIHLPGSWSSAMNVSSPHKSNAQTWYTY